MRLHHILPHQSENCDHNCLMMFTDNQTNYRDSSCLIISGEMLIINN
jgi:hypothetical protein